MRSEIKLYPPVAGRSPNYRIRGTYLGCHVDRSAQTGDRATARKMLEKIKREIERGQFAEAAGPTFARAAVSYMNAGGERRFMPPILLEIGTVSLSKIDQATIDRIAMKILPNATPATRNRQVYTPIQAVLRHAKLSIVISRPRGAQGRQRRDFLRPEQVDRYIDAAWSIHPRFAALCALLYYCGPRLSEALAIQIADVDLEQGYIDVPDTKNGEPQRLLLVPYVTRAIRIALNQPANRTWTDQVLPRTTGSLFCLTKSGSLYALFTEVAAAAKVEIPDDVSFHIFRHSYGAMMRARGVKLEETGRWTSRGGAAPYGHYEISEAAKAALTFPGADGAPKLKEIG